MHNACNREALGVEPKALAAKCKTNHDLAQPDIYRILQAHLACEHEVGEALSDAVLGDGLGVERCQQHAHHLTLAVAPVQRQQNRLRREISFNTLVVHLGLDSVNTFLSGRVRVPSVRASTSRIACTDTAGSP